MAPFARFLTIMFALNQMVMQRPVQRTGDDVNVLLSAGADGEPIAPLASPLHHLLIVFHSYQTGGTETLIYRMARWLTQHGVQVTVLLGYVGDTRVPLPSGRVLTIGAEKYLELFDPAKAKRIVADHHLHGVSHIFAVDAQSFWIALVLSRFITPPAKVLTGCYYQWEFMYPKVAGGVTHVAKQAIHAIAFDRWLPDANKLFVSATIRREHERNYARSLADSPVWILPLDFSIFDGRAREPQHGLIVSIGRFCSFKTYNFYMLDVIKALVEEGRDVRWEVFGDGDTMETVRARIEEAGLQGRVRVVGPVRYEQLADALSNAYLFVGMGTALLEAGCFGVVSIPAVVNTLAPKTYGFLHELPFGACGEELEEPPQMDVASLVRKALDWDRETYDATSARTREYVAPYECDYVMRAFVRHAGDSGALRGQALVTATVHAYSWAYRLLRWWRRRRSRSAARTYRVPGP